MCTPTPHSLWTPPPNMNQVVFDLYIQLSHQAIVVVTIVLPTKRRRCRKHLGTPNHQLKTPFFFCHVNKDTERRHLQCVRLTSGAYKHVLQSESICHIVVGLFHSLDPGCSVSYLHEKRPSVFHLT